MAEEQPLSTIMNESSPTNNDTPITSSKEETLEENETDLAQVKTDDASTPQDQIDSTHDELIPQDEEDEESTELDPTVLTTFLEEEEELSLSQLDPSATTTSLEHKEEEELSLLSPVDNQEWLKHVQLPNSTFILSNEETAQVLDSESQTTLTGTTTNTNSNSNSTSLESQTPQFFRTTHKLLENLHPKKDIPNVPDDDDDDEQSSQVNECSFLMYCPNLFDMCINSLRECMKMTDEKRYTLDTDGSIIQNNRNRGGKGRWKGRNNRSNASPKKKNQQKDNDDADADGWVQVEAEEELIMRTTESNNNRNSSTPHNRTISTFHSLTVLISLLYPMLIHEEKDNQSLKMTGPTMRKTKAKHVDRKSQVYILFPKVYSITTVRAFEELEMEFGKVLACLNLTYSDLEDSRTCSCSTNDEDEEDSMVTTINLVKQKIASLFDINHRSQTHIVTNLFPKDQSPTTRNFSKQMDKQLILPLHAPSNDRTEHERSIRDLHKRLDQKLSGRYKGHTLTVYGSCLSGLALGRSSDVDVSLYLPELQRYKDGRLRGSTSDSAYERQVKNHVYTVTRAIERQRMVEFANVVPVTRARVPVVKGVYLHAKNPWSHDGSMSFDICFLNDIAVKNSCLIREYSQYDDRVKFVMLAVKSWTKYKNISSAADNTLSSYAWMNLVIFYLQCIDFIPNLQCPQLMEAHGMVPDPQDRWSTIDGLKTVFVSSAIVKQKDLWKPNETFATSSVSWLLMGFFNFYAQQFPFESAAVSIRHGKCVIQKSVFRSARLWRMCIEDPFETHDSHAPHDLGTPLTMEGQFKINEYLTEAAESMTRMLDKCETITDCIGSYVHVGNQEDAKDAGEKEIMNRPMTSRGNNHVRKSQDSNASHNGQRHINSRKHTPNNQPKKPEMSGKKTSRNGGKRRRQPKKENGKSGNGKDQHNVQNRQENKTDLNNGEINRHVKQPSPPGTEPRNEGDKHISKQDSKMENPNKSSRQRKPNGTRRRKTKPRQEKPQQQQQQQQE